jgi:hypothetical protein
MDDYGHRSVADGLREGLGDTRLRQLHVGRVDSLHTRKFLHHLHDIQEHLIGFCESAPVIYQDKGRSLLISLHGIASIGFDRRPNAMGSGEYR